VSDPPNLLDVELHAAAVRSSQGSLRLLGVGVRPICATVRASRRLLIQ
jgi:hypothetical protein